MTSVDIPQSRQLEFAKSDNHDEQIGDLFDCDLKLRREVLGPEYVDALMKAANDFMMAF